MAARHSKQWRIPGLILLLLLAGLGSSGAAPATAAPVRHVGPPVGPIQVMAFDRQNRGWTWAEGSAAVGGVSTLVRIENGAGRVVADSQINPTLLPPSLLLQHMVVSGDGATGWASGVVDAPGMQVPLLWQLVGGSWRRVASDLPDSKRISSLTLSSDGSEGWLTITDINTARGTLRRLRGGAWRSYPAFDDTDVEMVAISPDGQQGWAVGRQLDGTHPTAYRLVNGGWSAPVNLSYPIAQAPVALTVDGQGNGWLIAGAQRGAALHALWTMPGAPVPVYGTLVRLPASGAPRLVPVVVPAQADAPKAGAELSAVAVDPLGRGWLTVALDLDTADPNTGYPQYRQALIRVDGETLTPIASDVVELSPEPEIDPTALDITADGGHTWLAGYDSSGLGHLNELAEPWPHAAPPVALPLPGAARCFPEVPHCLRSVLRAYWETHGGLAQFGFPITPEVREKQGDATYTVQYTERARLEYHPEYAGTANEVLLGLLGNTLADPRRGEAPFKPTTTALAGARFFSETGHNLAAPFLDYWTRTGGLPAYGLPRSEAFQEKNSADGQTYLVQYFERNRLEYHPANRGTPYEYLLGLLGREQFRATYGYTP